MLQEIASAITVFENYPEPGINFRNIGPLLKNRELCKNAKQKLFEIIKSKLEIPSDNSLFSAGLDARGFIIGEWIAEHFNLGHLMIRKKGKLPGKTTSSELTCEYKTNSSALEIEIDENLNGKNVIICDDLVATGGTLLSAIELCKSQKLNIIGIVCLIDFVDMNNLPKRNEINKLNIPIISLLQLNSFSKTNILEISDINNNSKSDNLTQQVSNINNISKSDNLTQNNLTPIKFIPMEHFDILDKRAVVFAHETMSEISENLVSSFGGFRLGTIKWERFADNMPNITFEHPDGLLNKDIVFIMSISSLDIIVEQMSFLRILPAQGIKSLNVVLPFFAVGTHERVQNEGTLATADPISQMLANIPLSKSGPTKFFIYDPHTLHNRHYFPKETSIYVPCSYFKLLNEIFREQNKTLTIKLPIIVFPDDGAYKRFGNDFKQNGYDIIVCNKKRIGDNRFIEIAQNSLINKDINNDFVIFDDLVQTGGTLIECAKKIKELYPNSNIMASCAHAVFPKDCFNKIVESKLFSKFYVTNSNPTVTNKLINIKLFEIIDITKDIGSILSNHLQILIINKNLKNIIKVFVGSTNNTKLKCVYEQFDNMLLKLNNTKPLQQNHSYLLKVIGLNVSSGVDPQPVGKETAIGCYNRINNVKQYLNEINETWDCIVGIENGIVEHNNNNKNGKCYSDIPFVGILKKRDLGKTTYYLSTLPNTLKNLESLTMNEILEKNITLYDYEIKNDSDKNIIEEITIVHESEGTYVSEENFNQIKETNFQQHIGQIIEKNTGVPNEIWHTMYYPFKPRSIFIKNQLTCLTQGKQVC